MRYVLDTNVVSEMRKPESRRDEGVTEWIANQQAPTLYLPALVLYELELGVRRIEHRDARQGQRLRAWLGEVAAAFDGRILAFDQDVARHAAALQIPDPRSDHDCFIAATAIAHGMAVVTRNVKDFAALGVALINPWRV